MGKNKLPKFAEMQTFSNVLQAPFYIVQHNDHQIKGNWNHDFFKNDNPIIVELGCGKGEYTTGLASLHAGTNFIGVDIKGARMHTGAKFAIENGLQNVAFLRTNIEMTKQFFAAGEVSEIWLTFPDPQMKRTNKRLTSTRFIDYYRQFLVEGGIVHLKTDSQFQYLYTLEMAKANNFEIIANINDVYGQETVSEELKIHTYYENQWIGRGLKIKYLSFRPHREALVEPNVEIEFDTYRSFNRGVLMPENNISHEESEARVSQM